MVLKYKSEPIGGKMARCAEVHKKGKRLTTVRLLIEQIQLVEF